MSSRRRLPFQRQVTVPIRHDGTMLRASFPVYLLVPAALIVVWTG